MTWDMRIGGKASARCTLRLGCTPFEGRRDGFVDRFEVIRGILIAVSPLCGAGADSLASLSRSSLFSAVV